MQPTGTKEAAEAALRELPSVLGASVREDVFGHPREVHLLVRPGPDVRHLARDVRQFLEERLGVPVDQRVISIAQVSRRALEVPIQELVTDEAAGEDGEAAATPPRARLVYTGLESSYREGRITVRVRLSWRGSETVGEAVELDAGQGRVRAGALAALRAATAACDELVHLSLEAASITRAFEQEFALVAALAASPLLGRKPRQLTGAHPVDAGPESAGALAALKASNRVLELALRSRTPHTE